jgi:hypothetical protein
MSGQIKKTVLFTLKVALLLSPILLAVGFISFVEWVNPVSGHHYIFGNIDIKTIRYNSDARRFDFEVLLGSGLIDHIQKMTVAAIAIADMKVWAQRS